MCLDFNRDFLVWLNGASPHFRSRADTGTGATGTETGTYNNSQARGSGNYSHNHQSIYHHSPLVNEAKELECLGRIEEDELSSSDEEEDDAC